MGRYTGPRCKLCRREMTPLMLKGQRCLTDKCPIKGKKKYPPGPPRKRRAKLSDYAVQLREKQRIRRSYGLLEKQFRLLFFDALRMKGVTGDNMMSLLERRLDNVIFRMGFSSSRSQARQLVKHKHVTVNGRIVDIPSYRVVEGAVIAIREKFVSNVMLEDSIKLAKAIDSIPGWIEVDFEKRTGKIVRLPVREDLTSNFNDQLVVELYSK
ncbi:MAG TPA: 30S ribosomal protein S4 [Spirochaetota bacterium]|nr:30S ribosomal protein S4 [Spirochaetota bacterium]HPV41477.1 30S ribosomal protein S4 [Spirochaetota bacterium]